MIFFEERNKKSGLKCSMVGVGIFSEKMDIEFLKSDFIFNYIFIVLLNPFLLFFLPGAGLGFAMGKIIFSRSNCRRPKKSKDIILFAPSILMIEKLCDSARVDVSYNQWSGPRCVITRPSLEFFLKSVFFWKRLLWKTRRLWCCGFDRNCQKYLRVQGNSITDETWVVETAV